MGNNNVNSNFYCQKWVSVAHNIKKWPPSKQHTLLVLLEILKISFTVKLFLIILYKNFALNVAKSLNELLKAMNNIKSVLEELKPSRVPKNPINSSNVSVIFSQ